MRWKNYAYPKGLKKDELSIWSSVGKNWDMIVLQCTNKIGKSEECECELDALRHEYLTNKASIYFLPKNMTLTWMRSCLYRSSYTPKVSFISSSFFFWNVKWTGIYNSFALVICCYLLELLTFFVQVCRLSIPSAIMNKSHTSSVVHNTIFICA